MINGLKTNKNSQAVAEGSSWENGKIKKQEKTAIKATHHEHIGKKVLNQSKAIYLDLSTKLFLPNTPLQANTHQFLRFDGEFHGEVLHHFFGKTIHDERDGFFFV